ncbi:alpha/beta hydrolase family protein [Psychromicrobium sp. YIM B11713]|uniref:alpha/beta hydrolase family protein n=1 Tax=Psychromicrobium sp. YIM B11713 TaxID=3145233 RepID=UPI00374FB622
MVLARKIVKRGPRDFRRVELIEDGQKIRIGLDEFTSATGKFGIIDRFSSGHARIGKVTLIDEDEKLVERQVEELEPGSIQTGAEVEWTPDIFFSPKSISAEYKDVFVPTAYGEAPAWLLEGDPRGTWVIHIHGSWTDRSIMLRDVDAFRGWGFSSLVPTFRSDPEVIPRQGSSSHLGQTEWRDIESAINYALSEGAKNIVLSGWSLGGTMALLAAENSVHRDKIVGVVLVGPVTSWRQTIIAGAARAGVPEFAARLLIKLLGFSTFSKLLALEEPIDFRLLEWSDTPGRLQTPTLILHSKADKEVPWELSDRFQKGNPVYATLVTLPDSLHTQEWNTAPEQFVRVLNEWIGKNILSADTRQQD